MKSQVFEGPLMTEEKCKKERLGPEVSRLGRGRFHRPRDAHLGFFYFISLGVFFNDLISDPTNVSRRNLFQNKGIEFRNPREPEKRGKADGIESFCLVLGP